MFPQASSTASSVFRTTELLELILLYLPCASILTASRVCRHWHAVVASSLSLQRALFLTPVPERGALLELGPLGALPVNHCNFSDLPRTLQPVVNDTCARKFRLGHFDEPDADYDGGYMPMVTMSWLEHSQERQKQEEKPGGEEDVAKVHGGAGQPSWRRMLLAQPPPRRVEVMIYESDMFQLVKFWVECEDGVTFGMMYDKFRELVHGRSWGKRSMGWFFEL
ncbi:hypothetical protein GTA08_BOTSDO07490 [Neofusicoccum parvum]|uniref:Uncharacterized protein n=1 Tax=Neofusicoccum parvum TaxID=310453 RepID=A0ACB5SD02_9PEZI|nr:hypothetical protein GTA08_BOTSDO07490 [Neofusicoccum parvum]